MRSRSAACAWLLDKEWRELLASRAWWVMLVLIGPLVGVSFISAVRTYAEVSGLNGTAAGVGEAFSPLVGIWAPTFSACELAAAFLLPFVGDPARRRRSPERRAEARAAAPDVGASRACAPRRSCCCAGWLVASLPPVVAIAAVEALRRQPSTRRSWRRSSLGHLLNAGLTIALRGRGGRRSPSIRRPPRS